MNDEKVHRIPTQDLDGPAAIPARLRQLADQIERSADVRTVFVVMEAQQGISSECLGYRPKISQTLGILEFAKLQYARKIL